MWGTLNTPLWPYPDRGSELWSTPKRPVSSCHLSNEYSQIWLPWVWRIAAFAWSFSGNLQPPSVILGDRREAHRTDGGTSVEQRHNSMTTCELLDNLTKLFGAWRPTVALRRGSDFDLRIRDYLVLSSLVFHRNISLSCLWEAWKQLGEIQWKL